MKCAYCDQAEIEIDGLCGNCHNKFQETLNDYFEMLAWNKFTTENNIRMENI